MQADLYRDIRRTLTEGGIDDGEASAIAMVLLEDMCGMTRTDVLMGRVADNADEAMEAARRIAEGEPVQYVTGQAQFCGLTLHVEPGVLIPRPETEQLVRTVAAWHPRRVLDIGTGSGCIAIALATMVPEADVTAMDVEETALAIAAANAERVGAKVQFVRKDVLTQSLTDGHDEGKNGADEYDVIVSNPPYICHSESAEMESMVLDHEPHVALFVPDDDPLLFYRRIAMLATTALTDGGRLAFEINRRFGKETADMLHSLGYHDVQVMKDDWGNDRIVIATHDRSPNKA